MRALVGGALSDIAGGYKQRRLWIALATEDIFDQHRRTTLGPLWLVINYLAFTATFIFVFNRGGSDPGYAPYVAIGLLVWMFLSDCVTQAVTLFEREEAFIKGTTLPLSVYVMRLALQNAIRAGYAALGCIGVLVLGGVHPSPVWLWSLVGLAVALLTAPAIILVFAFVGALFPDTKFIIANLMRVAMFITPVFWIHGGEAGIRGLLYYWNPFTHFLDIVRQPIVEGLVPLSSLAICVAIAMALWALSFALLGAFRRQMALLI